MNISSIHRAWLLALRTPGLGPVGLRQRLEACDFDIQRVLSELQRTASGAAAAWLQTPDQTQLAADAAWLAQPNHRLLCLTDEDYPPSLGVLDDAPVALFVAGDASLLLYPQIAVVGSRNADGAGLAHARRFAGALAAAGLIVTSGLAEGVDGAAHAAALDAGHPTIAVVGTGLDRVYPRQHQALAQRIAEQGALVSEFPLGTPPRAEHFPRRNRIIAGLSLATLVVEAGLQSGSLITARLAVEQGREVFAIPGSIDNPLARGCHRLLREGARLVESASEIIEAVTGEAHRLGDELSRRLTSDASCPTSSESVPATRAGQAPGWRVDPDYDELLTALGEDPAGLDELVRRTGQSAAVVSSMLLMLELEGVVESLAGSRYQRLPE